MHALTMADENLAVRQRRGRHPQRAHDGFAQLNAVLWGRFDHEQVIAVTCEDENFAVSENR